MPHVPDSTPFHGGDFTWNPQFSTSAHVLSFHRGNLRDALFLCRNIRSPAARGAKGASPLSEFLIRKSKRSSRTREHKSTQSVDNHIYKCV